MPIIVTDDQGNTQEVCPAACYDGLFDPDNMSQEQIDAICNLFNCGPMDVGALATALYLLCQNGVGGNESAYTNWEPSTPFGVFNQTWMPILMVDKYGESSFFANPADDFYTISEDGFYTFGSSCGFTGINPSQPNNYALIRESILFADISGIGIKTMNQRQLNSFSYLEGMIGGEYQAYLTAGTTVKLYIALDLDSSRPAIYPLRDDLGRGGGQTWITQTNVEVI